MLTQSQWLWLQCQYFLDEGLLLCEQCAQAGHGPYCQSCGARLVPEGVVCQECHLVGTGSYCQSCGTALQESIGEAIVQGTFDWEEWAQFLQPFLDHGLTPREQSLLSHGA